MVDNKFFIRCLGFSQDLKTYDYIMVMELSQLGSLCKYINKNMTWYEKITALLDISIGLDTLHNSDLTRQDFIQEIFYSIIERFYLFQILDYVNQHL